MRGQQGLKETLLWIMVSYFGYKRRFKVKNILMMNLFLTNVHLLTSQDINWWTGVVWITCGLLWCFYQLFGLSFWRHPFTAEDPMVSKWFKATFLQVYSDEETKSSWMACGWVNCQQIFIFGRAVPFILSSISIVLSFKTWQITFWKYFALNL